MQTQLKGHILFNSIPERPKENDTLSIVSNVFNTFFTFVLCYLLLQRFSKEVKIISYSNFFGFLQN